MVIDLKSNKALEELLDKLTWEQLSGDDVTLKNVLWDMREQFRNLTLTEAVAIFKFGEESKEALIKKELLNIILKIDASIEDICYEHYKAREFDRGDLALVLEKKIYKLYTNLPLFSDINDLFIAFNHKHGGIIYLIASRHILHILENTEKKFNFDELYTLCIEKCPSIPDYCDGDYRDELKANKEKIIARILELIQSSKPKQSKKHITKLVQLYGYSTFCNNLNTANILMQKIYDFNFSLIELTGNYFETTDCYYVYKNFQRVPFTQYYEQHEHEIYTRELRDLFINRIRFCTNSSAKEIEAALEIASCFAHDKTMFNALSALKQECLVSS